MAFRIGDLVTDNLFGTTGKIIDVKNNPELRFNILVHFDPPRHDEWVNESMIKLQPVWLPKPEVAEKTFDNLVHPFID